MSNHCAVNLSQLSFECVPWMVVILKNVREEKTVKVINTIELNKRFLPYLNNINEVNTNKW